MTVSTTYAAHESTVTAHEGFQVCFCLRYPVRLQLQLSPIAGLLFFTCRIATFFAGLAFRIRAWRTTALNTYSGLVIVSRPPHVF